MPRIYQTCTSIHTLTFCPTISFNDPNTPDGKCWNAALKSITQIGGWNSLQWGARLEESSQTADLFIFWDTHASLLAFLSAPYASFLTLISSLLADIPPPIPYACECHPFLPGLYHDYISSVYYLHFSSGVDEMTDLGLGIETQLFRGRYQQIAGELNVSDTFPGSDVEGRFQNLEMVSLVRCPSPLPAPSELAGLFSAAGRPGPESKTFLLITKWKDQLAEREVMRRYHKAGDGEAVEDPLAKDILSKAKTFTRHQVALEEITEDNVEFLDKEEKYKTWMSRMLEEEEVKRRKRLGGNATGQADESNVGDA